jgi:hypothetical protein
LAQWKEVKGRTGFWSFGWLLGKYSGFLGKAYTALQKLEKSGKGKDIINHLVEAPETYKILETSSGSIFNPSNLEISWNSSDGTTMGDNGNYLRPRIY